MNMHVLRTALLAIPLAVASCTGTPVTPTLAPSGVANPASVGMTKSSEGGQVTVEATWGGPAVGATFDIRLDTHSVDLDALDLAAAVLRNDRGETLTARPWAAAKGGHHREGALTFGGDTPRFLAGARWIELNLVGVGTVPERTFRWTIGS
ncbi:MAG: hypothetical protein IVW53_12130 [Chloroflexi bacterium]|nr:hypothetical protein [Chloroflexota bacterium]